MNRKAFCSLMIFFLLLVSCSKKSEKITSLEQLQDKRICVLTGSAGDIAARKYFPNAIFLDMVGSADAALAVKTSKADAFVYDVSVLRKIIEKNPELVILDKPVSKLELAIALNQKANKLLGEINSAIEKLREAGTLDELKRKWVENEYSTPPVVSEGTVDGKSGMLKMGTCAIYEPFTFISNGVRTGLDIELSVLIGEILNKKIEIVDMAFDALIPALQSGKIDFALSDFTVTEERKKVISYSNPYISNDISVLVRK